MAPSYRFLAYSALLLPAILLASALVPAPRTLTTFDGRSEYVQFAVREQDSIEIPRARIFRAERAEGSPIENLCVQDLLIRGIRGRLTLARPFDMGGTVILSSGSDSTLAIDATLPGTGGRKIAAVAIRGPAFFYLEPDGGECPAAAATRVPVSGPVQVGKEGEDGTGKLLSGTLAVYGRVRPGNLLAFLAGRPRERADTIIYAASSLALPAGSRVGNLIGEQSGTDGGWTGFLQAAPNDPEGGFRAMLQTVASDVYVWNQAADSERPDKISIGLIARLASDPYLQWLIGVFGLFMVVLAIVAQRVPGTPE
ncbi:MAG: hypothetical protein ACOY45_16845 [Pseudomonadota bacterium]